MTKALLSKVLLVFLLVIVCLQPGFSQQSKRPKGWAVKIENQPVKNLWKLNDSIYRSGQPESSNIPYLEQIGMKGVLNLRSHHSDKEILSGSGITDYTVEMKADAFTDKEIIKALQVIASSQKPLLIHCKQGSDRTGVVIAMYRIIFQGWSKEQALNELQNGGYGFHDQYTNIPSYLKNVDIDKIKHALGK